MSDIAAQMYQCLTAAQKEILELTSAAADSSNAYVFLVGGAVRDILLRKTPKDLDIVIDGSPDEFLKDLTEIVDGKILTESQFGTFKFNIGCQDVDIAVARTETYSKPGALPTVSQGSLEEDLNRRDFSINAIAISINVNTMGELLDPFNGRQDLENELVRVLHKDSFIDDSTRILRAIRYATRLNFNLSPDTDELVQSQLGYLDTLSGDRLRNELRMILIEPTVIQILKDCQHRGILKAIHPGLNTSISYLNKIDVLLCSKKIDEQEILSALLYPVPTSLLQSIVERLSIEGQWRKIAYDIQHIHKHSQKLSSENIRRSEIYFLLRDIQVPVIKGFRAMTEVENIQNNLNLYLDELQQAHPTLNGKDLVAMGIPEGPKIGILLKQLLEERLDGRIKSRQEEENLVKRNSF